MAKRVFFSFHYQDVIDFRANVVRNHWLTKPDREEAGFFDASLWESTKRQGSYALKRLINSGLDNTSVTCVLIGSETYLRPWVRYEILKSFIKGNKLIGVHINGIRDKFGYTKVNGPNPFSYVGITFSNDGTKATFWELLNETSNIWSIYRQIDETGTYSWENASPELYGKGHTLSHFVPTYDWVVNDGYSNFSKWVDW